MTDSKGILSISSLYLLKQIVDVAEEFRSVAYLKSQKLLFWASANSFT